MVIDLPPLPPFVLPIQKSSDCTNLMGRSVGDWRGLDPWIPLHPPLALTIIIYVINIMIIIILIMYLGNIWYMPEPCSLVQICHNASTLPILGCVHINTSTSLALYRFPYTSLRVFQWRPFTYIEVRVTCKFYSYKWLLCRSCFYQTRAK